MNLSVNLTEAGVKTLTSSLNYGTRNHQKTKKNCQSLKTHCCGNQIAIKFIYHQFMFMVVVVIDTMSCFQFSVSLFCFLFATSSISFARVNWKQISSIHMFVMRSMNISSYVVFITTTNDCSHIRYVSLFVPFNVLHTLCNKNECSTYCTFGRLSV